MQEIELIILGKVQGVGYRQYVAEVGNELKLKGFVKNLKDRTVQIRCKGDEKAINEFKKQINVQKPKTAPFINVTYIKSKPLKQGTIKQKFFEEKYGKLDAEMSQGFSTGMNYMRHFNDETQTNFGLLIKETHSGFERMDEHFERMDKHFERMDEKYDAISKAMFAVVDSIREETKENREELRVTIKTIESLLKILVEKKD